MREQTSMKAGGGEKSTTLRPLGSTKESQEFAAANGNPIKRKNIAADVDLTFSSHVGGLTIEYTDQ